MLDYIRDAAEIYRQSFATIRAEPELSRFPADVARVVVRLIHTCGQVDVADHVAFTDEVVERRDGGGRPVGLDADHGMPPPNTWTASVVTRMAASVANSLAMAAIFVSEGTPASQARADA